MLEALQQSAVAADGDNPWGEYGASNLGWAVHRNTIRLGLIDVLMHHYPTLVPLMGEESFKSLARAYADNNPASSTVLTFYGANLADYIGSIEAFKAWPYLADMARLDWALHNAHYNKFSAASAEAVSEAADQAQIEPSRLISSDYALFDLYHACQQPDNIAEPLNVDNAQTVAITQDKWQIQPVLLTGAVAALASQMQRSLPLMAALEVCAQHHTPEALTSAVAGLLQQKLLHIPNQKHERQTP